MHIACFRINLNNHSIHIYIYIKKIFLYIQKKNQKSHKHTRKHNGETRILECASLLFPLLSWWPLAKGEIVAKSMRCQHRIETSLVGDTLDTSPTIGQR